METGMWHGEPITYRRVRAILGPFSKVPAPWWRELIGSERIVVEIITAEGLIYLDDQNAPGWFVLTRRRGERYQACVYVEVERVLEEVDPPSKEEIEQHYQQLGM